MIGFSSSSIVLGGFLAIFIKQFYLDPIVCIGGLHSDTALAENFCFGSTYNYPDKLVAADDFVSGTKDYSGPWLYNNLVVYLFYIFTALTAAEYCASLPANYSRRFHIKLIVEIAVFCFLCFLIPNYWWWGISVLVDCFSHKPWRFAGATTQYVQFCDYRAIITFSSYVHETAQCFISIAPLQEAVLIALWFWFTSHIIRLACQCIPPLLLQWLPRCPPRRIQRQE